MKFIRKITISFFFIILCTGSSISNEKTAFVNVDYLIKNSNIGKQVLGKIDNQNRINIEKLEKKNKFLKELEQEIKKKQNIVSETDFNNEVLSFRKKIKIYNDEKNEIVKSFNDLRNREIKNIFDTINPIINDYMKDNSINILLDSKNVFMGSTKVDFTNDILKKINNKLK